MVERNSQEARSRGSREAGAPPRDPALQRLDRLVSLARGALLWERFWRGLLVPALVLGLFLCLSFAGLWLEVGRPWRILGVVLLALAFLVGLVPLVRLALPSRREALARIDRESGLAHHPASGLDDTLANPGDDPATQALWVVHRRRMAQTIAALRAGRPSPRMVEVDHYALRAAVFLALVACGFLAGPEKYARVAAAFDWHGGASDTGGYRLDAWIDPPAYTGKAPVLLNLAAAEAHDTDHPLRLEVPIGSTVIVRSAGGAAKVETHGALEEVKDKPADGQAAKDAAADLPASLGRPAANPNPNPAPRVPVSVPALGGGTEQRFSLHGDARLGLWHGSSLAGMFELSAIPDKPPQIQLTDVPHANARGSLSLSYKISDDYGVIGAEAEFRSPAVDGQTRRLRSLVDPPRLALNLAPGPGGLGDAETTGDLSDHPWAGAHVTMTLTARDEGGNVGRSDPIDIVLPQKIFTKPIARALAEQRRNLVLFPDDRDRVDTALDALMIAPDLFGTSAGVYLGLSVGRDMLRKAHSDADILQVADYLWAMALDIENGSLTDAERELRAAEQKLQEALQRNAPDEEVAKLTQDLKAAMDKFLKELAEKQMREQGKEAQERPDSGRSISRKDLQSMLDRMQDMARAGDRANAQKMLDQLQNLLDNLQTARRQEVDPTRRQMNQALNELDSMTREQQELRDDTHRQGQQAQQPRGNDMRRPGPHRRGAPDPQRQGRAEDGQPGDQPNKQAGDQPGDQASDQALQARQRALRDRLEKLQKRMQQNGQGQDGLGEAGKAMHDAEQALGEGEQGREAAEDAQGRALEALRRQSQQMAEQMQQGEGQQGQEVGDGEGENGSSFRAQGSDDTDPLGRPLSSDPLNPRARFDPMGVPAAQRAQRVLEELRRRLADPSRPREEMDYLERLLKRY